jgi:hypothetical protein
MSNNDEELNNSVNLKEKLMDEKMNNEDIKTDYEEEKKEDINGKNKKEIEENDYNINIKETKIENENINQEDMAKWELR